MKLTDTHRYLHRYGFHPGHSKHGIPYSQALRICRTCSKTQNYLQRVRELKSFLMNRGCNEDDIQTEVGKGTGLNRGGLLQPKMTRVPLGQIPLLVTYRPGLPHFKSILDKHLPIPAVFDRLRQTSTHPWCLR